MIKLNDKQKQKSAKENLKINYAMQMEQTKMGSVCHFHSFILRSLLHPSLVNVLAIA